MINDSSNKKKLIVVITGASGAMYGIRLLEILNSLKLETHLIISKAGLITISMETNFKPKDLIALANYHYNQADIGAPIASGSFRIDGMIIAPCSMKTLSAIASGFEENLIIRAAGVIIKEQKKLALIVRESPLSAINLENMLKLSRLGVAICPPVPAFYNNPKSIDDLVNYSVLRTLDLFEIDTGGSMNRWSGL